MPISRMRRGVSLAVIVAATVAIVVTAMIVALSQPRYPGPLDVELADDLLDELSREAEDRLLRERLGGLAALVTDDDALADCTRPDPSVPVPPETDTVEAVRAATEHLRGLTLDEPVEVRLLDDDAMTDRVAELFARRWSGDRLDVEHRTLTTLAAVEPGTDLFGLRVDAFASQVSGYYGGSDPEIGVRTADPSQLSPLERVVLAHEFEHALTAQNLGRPAVESVDGAIALSAVVEGSAVVAMRMYAEAVLSTEERERLREELLARARADALAGYSPYLRAELQFPYVEGARFVCERWLEGGWEAVNSAYEDPPATTAAVLFGQRHGEPPGEPAGLGEPGDAWDEVRSVDFGAAQLAWLLAAPGGDLGAALDDPRGRAAAWDGGELVVWSQFEQTALGLALVDRGGGPPLCESVQWWYEAAFPLAELTPMPAGTPATTAVSFVDEGQHAVVTCEGHQVRLGIAPAAEQAAAIAN